MKHHVIKRLVWTASALIVFAVTGYAQNDFVYVRNDVSISGFSVTANGALQPVPGSPFYAGGLDSSESASFSASRIIVNRDFLFASNGRSGSISVFSINRTTGSLSPVPGSPFFNLAYSSRGVALGVTPDNKYLYAVNLEFGYWFVYGIAPNGALTLIPQVSSNIGASTEGIKIDPTGRFLAVALPLTRAVAMYRIGADGSLASVPGSPFATSGPRPGPASIEINCAGDVLFVGQVCSARLCATPTTVDVFSIAPNGSLTPIPGSPFAPNVGQDAGVIALSRDERRLFITNQVSNTVTVFEVAANGALTLVPGSPFHDAGFALGPGGVATNTAETLLFTTNYHGPLSIFRLAPDGVLTTIPGSPFSIGGGSAVLSLAVYPPKICVPVVPFDICIQDDSTGHSLKFKTASGEYQFRTCAGVVLAGTGTLTRRGGAITLEDNKADRMVLAKVDTSLNRASASVRIIAQATTFTITDRNTTDNNCSCRPQSVTRRVPTDYARIQQAIDAAREGDIVLVAPGTYFESINFNGKAITVMSEAGPESTIIDGRNHFGPAVTFMSQEGRQSVLSGFTVQKGIGYNDYYLGGGIFIALASPTIAHNIVTDNSGAVFGGGIGVLGGAPLIQGNVVSNNGASNGGGIALLNAPGTSVIDNKISGNTAYQGGGVCLSGVSGTTVISGNVVTNNLVNGLIFGDGTPASPGGGIAINDSSGILLLQNQVTANIGDFGAGIALFQSDITVVSNTIADNDARSGYSAFYILRNVTGTLHNNLIVAKQGQSVFGCRSDVSTFQLVLRNNNLYAPGGTAFGGNCSSQTIPAGNISADPLFVNSAAGDYHLLNGSPSIDRGDNAAPNLLATDLDGNPRISDGDSDGVKTIDLGAYELPAPFDISIRDDINGNFLQFNSRTGDYRFVSCRDSFSFAGRGTVQMQSCKIEIRVSDRNGIITALANACTRIGSASVQSYSMRRTYSLTDANITDNLCACK